MVTVTRSTESFPSACIRSHSDGLPIEVVLIAQLGRGAGNKLFHDTCSRQKAHSAYVDELDEPSARLAGTDIAKGENTALYSFAVGRMGHPFHRHAGHRIFTAVSGSGGAQLRFSTVSPNQLLSSPPAFVDALHYVDIPPDCLFTVRFDGGTWHQFAPSRPDSAHPVLFALSCHTDELGGIDDPVLASRIIAGEADIPSLTELLPPAVSEYLQANPIRHEDIPTTSLALDAPPESLHSRLCGGVRGLVGTVQGLSNGWRRSSGFVGRRLHGVTELPGPPEDSLLRQHLTEGFDHQDSFVLSTHMEGMTASSLLAEVLQGFLSNRPAGVSWLMRLRNLLVRPLNLRTSPLGCPASPLLSTNCQQMFAGRYPVLQHSIDEQDRYAQVVLGADDKHLRFRSCVSVRIIGGNEVHVSLGTRVQCSNLFGRLYMASIDGIHRSYISPIMLAMAVEYAERQSAVESPVAFAL